MFLAIRRYSVSSLLLLVFVLAAACSPSAAVPETDSTEELEPADTLTDEPSAASTPSPAPTATPSPIPSPSVDLTATVHAVETLVLDTIQQQMDGTLTEEDAAATFMALEGLFAEPTSTPAGGQSAAGASATPRPDLDVTVDPSLSLVSGRAFWADTGDPIEGFEITLTQDPAELKQVTDSDGNYIFADLPPGTYMMSIAYEYGQNGNLPCTEFSMKTPLEGSWLSLGGTTASGGQVMIAIGPEFTIGAGEARVIDFEFTCD